MAEGRSGTYTADVTVLPAIAAATLQKRELQRRESLAADRASVRERLPGAVRRLREQFGATQIWLFGSLARGGWTEQSDVDIAALGIPNRDYWLALSDLSEALGCDVDLIRLESASASITARVQLEGEPL